MAEPKPSKHSTNERTMTFVRSGETLDDLARQMASCSPGLTAQKAKAILIENNGISEPVRITEGQLLLTDPAICAPAFRAQNISTARALDQQFATLNDRAWSVLEHHANIVPLAIAAAEDAERAGWRVDVSTLIQGAGYAFGAADGFVGAGHSVLADIRKLVSDLVAEAVRSLGKAVVFSKQPSDLMRVERFIRASPKYTAVQAALRTLPTSLAARLGRITPTVGVPYADARWLRRQFVLPAAKGSPTAYATSVSRRLGSQIAILGRVGVATTWLLPAAIGVYNVREAPPLERPRIAFQEASAVVLGAVGTGVGVLAGGTIIAALTLT